MVAMKRRELFNLGLAASIATVLPKALTEYRWVSQGDPRVRGPIRLSVGGYAIEGVASGEFVQFDAVQRSRSYNHMAVHRVGEGRR